MAYTIQVTVDSSHPHDLRDWWAETLGWEVEEQDAAFIQRMIDEGQATESDTMQHKGRLVWREGAATRSPDGDSSQGVRLYFQEVPEAKTVKNRMHLDLRIGDDDVETVRARLIERGAVVVGGGRQGPHTWVTMTDPEGNEFCL